MTSERKRRPMKGHNEGSIFQRKDGRWVATVSLPNGRRRSAYCKRAANDREAAKVLLKQLLDARESPLSPRIALGPFLRLWLDEVVDKVRPMTMRHYSLCVGHLEAGIGHIPVADLSASDVSGYLRRVGQGRSPQTVRHHRGVLRNALNWGIAQDLLTQNVAKRAKPPRLPAREMVVLSADETTRLLNSTEGDRHHALWTVAAMTGMRAAELLGLCWRDVDVDGGRLVVRQQLQRVDGAFVMVEPKSRQSRRTVPLAPMVVIALRHHRLIQAQERLATGVGGDYHGLVFTSPAGLPLHHSPVLRAFHQALVKAALPRVRLHDLRHGVASILLAQGVSPRLVMELLGHSTVTLTLDTYSHVSAALVRETADSLQLAIGGGR